VQGQHGTAQLHRQGGQVQPHLARLGSIGTATTLTLYDTMLLWSISLCINVTHLVEKHKAATIYLKQLFSLIIRVIFLHKRSKGFVTFRLSKNQ